MSEPDPDSDIGLQCLEFYSCNSGGEYEEFPSCDNSGLGGNAFVR